MIRKKEEEKQEEPIHSKHREAEQTDGTKRYKRMQGCFKNKQPLDTTRTVHTHSVSSSCCSSDTKGITHLLAPEGDARKRFRHDTNMQHTQQPDSSLERCGTKKPGTILTWVQFHDAARDLYPTVNFQCRLYYGVCTPLCAMACINICAHFKNPKHWQPHHWTQKILHTLAGMSSTALVAAAVVPR